MTRLIASSLTLAFLVLVGSAYAHSPAPIRAQTLVITAPTPCCSNGTVATAYVQNLFVSGATAPVTWTIPSGQLPPGVTLCPSAPASLDGMPTTAGTFTFTLRVTDSQGAQASEPSRITIEPTTPSTPATLSSLAVSPACVTAGTDTTGTVSLSGPAPTSGATVFLPNNEPSVATWPASVTVPAGRMTASFRVSTQAVAMTTTVQIVAGYGGQNQFAELTVFGVPPPPPIGAWALTGSMSAPRLFDTATVLQTGQVLIVGGEAASAELYDPSTGAWSPTGSMSTDRAQHTATLLPNGAVLVAGGGGSGSVALSSAELYHPSTGTWTLTGNMHDARTDASATLLPNGQVLVAGGDNATSTPLASAELYTPATGVWSKTGRMTTARSGPSATLLLNGEVLVAGGASVSAVLASAELYNPASGTWASTGSMTTARVNQQATLLPTGEVLVTGGSATGLFAERYDPTSGQWSSASPGACLAPCRLDGSATVLQNGKVLVAGGFVGKYPNQNTTTGATLYDPATNSWSTAGSLHVARARQTASLLPNGQILVAGGQNETRNRLTSLTSAELYAP